MTARHTPLPWELRGATITDSIVLGGQRAPVCHLYGTDETVENNGSHIVLCVNTHASMLEALEAAKTALKEATIVISEIAKLSEADPMKGSCMPRLIASIAQTSAAIKAARGE